MSQRLHVQVLSDQDYEELIAECYIDDDCLLIVSQENGLDQLEVEILARPDGGPSRVGYDAIVELLRKAKNRLWELRKAPGSGEQGP